MILVTTANGATGRPMVDYLLEDGFGVRALVRKDDARAQELREAGAEVVFGDLLDLREVRAALDGVQRAYFNYPLGDGLVEAAVMFTGSEGAEARTHREHVTVSVASRRTQQDHPEPLAGRAGLRVVRRPDHSPAAHGFRAWLLYISGFIRRGRYAMPFNGTAASLRSPVVTSH